MKNITCTLLSYDEWNDTVRQHFNVPEYNIFDWEEWELVKVLITENTLNEYEKNRIAEFDENHGFDIVNILATKLAMDGVIPSNKYVLISH